MELLGQGVHGQVRGIIPDTTSTGVVIDEDWRCQFLKSCAITSKFTGIHKKQIFNKYFCLCFTKTNDIKRFYGVNLFKNFVINWVDNLLFFVLHTQKVLFLCLVFILFQCYQNNDEMFCESFFNLFLFEPMFVFPSYGSQLLAILLYLHYINNCYWLV